MTNNSRYEFTLTDAEGNPKHQYVFEHSEIRRSLVYQFYFSELQVDHALAVLHTTPKGNIFELSEFGQTDNKQLYLRSGRLKLI